MIPETGSAPRVAVVVPNWNGRHLLEECLDSLGAQSVPARVIVVDNGSVDGSASLVRSGYPGTRLVELDHNHGFTGAVNRGIEVALAEGADFVALLNNDARADEHWLERLLAAMEDHTEVGIVTSKVLMTDGRHFDSAGNHYSVWGHPFPRGRDELDVGQYDERAFVFGGSGGASLYRVAMMAEIGLFDDDFFAYYEDDDVSFRAQLAGWKVMYEPASLAHHRVAATSSKHPTLRHYHVTKNAFFLFHKNMPTRLYFRYLPRFTVGFLSLLAGVAKRRDFAALVPSLWRIAVTLGPLIKKRRSIQDKRVVSDAYVSSILYHGVPPTHRYPFVRPRRRSRAEGSGGRG
ncbi:MAG TPA: glycosyltransferase family 2 protein [Acidimicrobiales bacterium]|nr:glycosyltransferase family 2 protein [Acidimicrobiales bacterium]